MALSEENQSNARPKIVSTYQTYFASLYRYDVSIMTVILQYTQILLRMKCLHNGVVTNIKYS